MEFEHDLVFALYLAGQPQLAIVIALQHLNVNKYFVSCTIASQRDTGSIAWRPKSDQKKKVTITE